MKTIIIGFLMALFWIDSVTAGTIQVFDLQNNTNHMYIIDTVPQADIGNIKQDQDYTLFKVY